jgi:hypothetical protein
MPNYRQRPQPTTGRPKSAYQRYKDKLAVIQKKHLDKLSCKTTDTDTQPVPEVSIADAPLSDDGVTVVLTGEMIDRGQSDAGGWSRRQLVLIGVEWPPRKGWKRDAIGRRIQVDAYLQFLKLRKVFKKPAG